MAGDDHIIKEVSRREQVFYRIYSERMRQERLKATGKFLYTCADPQMLSADKYLVLGEEFGEVGRAILNMQGYATDYKAGLEDIQKELIQLAAVCVAWLEFIEQVIGDLNPVSQPPANEGQ